MTPLSDIWSKENVCNKIVLIGDAPPPPFGFFPPEIHSFLRAEASLISAWHVYLKKPFDVLCGFNSAGSINFMRILTPANFRSLSLIFERRFIWGVTERTWIVVIVLAILHTPHSCPKANLMTNWQAIRNHLYTLCTMSFARSLKVASPDNSIAANLLSCWKALDVGKVCFQWYMDAKPRNGEKTKHIISNTLGIFVCLTFYVKRPLAGQ